ncbi:hypothetical protein MYCTH_2305454 [Thermothelomyces thermophilus ATCC 42464]|uniref:Uncharacterized protein n=1 Tax=Thermothelomyces thermophilus (strain ATCC 42464 / BCRC 31852 / DSM 1799) TaxID=573729 RepID=G2QD35_THET4|nr:uncharacterized protein MYCTH_2305454 [Thermothelomyces thermophilus ATCC 42464]AEO58253.1 hypothetical protein MYCTH_2305454 [Thermothelomyces thermophilus ATCC 42464]
MPAVLIRTIKIVTRTIQARQTVHSFPPFHDHPDDDDDDDLDVDKDDIFPFDRDELHDGDEHLSEGTVAAIVVSLVVFFIVVGGLLAYLRHRRRRKGKETEVAMKEASAASATAAASASVAAPPGALDPPPPYDEVHGDSAPQPVGELPASEPRSAANLGVGAAAVGLARREEEEEEGGGEGEDEDDADAIGSHATITDGLAPGRHADAGRPGEGGSTAVVMPGKDPEVKMKEVTGKS